MRIFIYNIKGYEPIYIPNHNGVEIVSGSNLPMLVKENPDVVVFNGAGHGKLADKLKNIRVVGTCGLCDELTLNKKFAHNIIEGLGVEAYDIDKDYGNAIDMSSEMWFQAGKPLYPAVYEVAGMVRAYKVKQPYVVQKIFKPIFLLIEKARYTGPLSVDYIVIDKKKVVFKRFNGCLSNYFNEVMELVSHDFFFEKIANSELDSMPLKSGYSYRLPSVGVYSDSIESITVPSCILSSLKNKLDKLKELKHV
jgi:hypothetical protein